MILVLGVITINFAKANAQVTGVQNVQSQNFSGEVIKIENRTLSVKTSDETKQITVPNSIQIKRNALNATFENIKVNDLVSVSQTTDGEVLSISVTPSTVKNTAKIAVPIAILAIFLILAIIYFLRKRNSAFIKTSIEKI